MRQTGSTWCSSPTLLYLVSTQPYLLQSIQVLQTLIMVENLKDCNSSIFHWKWTLGKELHIWERETGKKGPEDECSPVYLYCWHQQSQSQKLQREKEREQTEMGEAPQGIELSDIPFKCTGIKPGVKPPLLFRLDATKQKAIWQTVRPLNTVCLLQLLYLHCLPRESGCNWRNAMWHYKTFHFPLNILSK